jgi:PAS domain-containing protein
MAFAPGWRPDRALVALIDALDEGALIFDENGRCRLAGRRAAELLGTDARELVGIARQELLQRVVEASTTPFAVFTLAEERLSESECTVVDPIELRLPLARTVVWTSVPMVRGRSRMGRIDVLRDVTRERRAEEAHEAVGIVEIVEQAGGARARALGAIEVDVGTGAWKDEPSGG